MNRSGECVNNLTGEALYKSFRKLPSFITGNYRRRLNL